MKTTTIFGCLGGVAPIIPSGIYWLDKNNIILGGNERAFQGIGKSLSDVIGKSICELYTKETADNIVQHSQMVIQTESILSWEEMVKDIVTGKVKYFNVVRSPLRDDNQIIIGTITISIDMADSKKMEELEDENKTHKRFFFMLEKAVFSIPVFIYWKDKNSVFLGGNKLSLQTIGYESNEELKGKTDYDLWPKFAEKYIADDKEVIETGKIISKEDVFPNKNGEIRYCVVTKAPLCDEYGAVIGIIGNSMDITDQKNNERLENENKRQKDKIQANEKYVTVVQKIARIVLSTVEAFRKKQNFFSDKDLMNGSVIIESSIREAMRDCTKPEVAEKK